MTDQQVRTFLSPEFGEFKHVLDRGHSTLTMVITSQGNRTKCVLKDPRWTLNENASMEDIMAHLKKDWSIAYYFDLQCADDGSRRLECEDDTGREQRFVIHPRRFDLEDL